ncbi:MAG: glycosyltransferase [Sphingobacteriia bacterium]|jgi:polyisoprenyl-phosphate glycosyltransferase|nr:glycosyltransferase [Sphingobacteriia bacterium]
MRLALVLPCYNEEEVLRRSIEQLTILLDKMVAVHKITPDSFMMFVNDGSRDATWDIIVEQFRKNSYVKGVNLSINVGHQNAIMAGMMTAMDMSDAVVTIDADLQDDIAAIEIMVDRYREGCDVVYGVKVSRTADSFIKRSSAVMFYKLQAALGVNTVYNHADFRLMSRRALQQLSRYKERNLYLRGIVPLIGYKTATVNDVIREREAGKSKYTLKKMLNLAMDGITSFSVRPIYWIIAAGFFFLIVSVLATIYILISFFSGHIVPGWTSLMLSLWFIGAIILLGIGIIGQYIGKIYIEVKQRPRYNIETILDEKKEQSSNDTTKESTDESLASH